MLILDLVERQICKAKLGRCLVIYLLSYFVSCLCYKSFSLLVHLLSYFCFLLVCKSINLLMHLLSYFVGKCWRRTIIDIVTDINFVIHI